MAFQSFPDIFSWIGNLPPISQWETNPINNSIRLCPSCLLSSSSQPSLKLSIKNFNNSDFSLSISADYNLPIFLWNSEKVKAKPKSPKLLDDEDTCSLLLSNFIEDVLKYCPNTSQSQHSLQLPPTYPQEDLKDIFNFSILSLTFIICIYEAPPGLRGPCLSTLKDQFACPKSREVSITLMRLLGSDAEEHWMRSVNLGITNWISELQAANLALQTPSPLFSYSLSRIGLWKIQLCCPVIAMDIEKSTSPSPDDRLLFSLNHHQLEGVIQMNYAVDIQEKWIEVMVNTDNIRCDVISLLTDTQMSESGAGTSEKHFPPRISLQITPTQQTNVISVSVSKSTQNPSRGIATEKGVDASFEPPTAIGLHLSAGENITTSLTPWQFEQSVHGNAANLNWFLHDSGDGREVFSSKPSKFALLHPKSWFKHRYSTAHRAFTRQGGVIFAGDEYGEGVNWKLERARMGRTMEWEIKGWIWVTYWSNKHMTFYTETRRLKFREVLHLNLV